MLNEREHFKSKASTIRLGGVDIREVSRKDWHAQIGVIVSENFFFNGTLRENISWNMRDYSDEKAMKYIRMLNIERDFSILEVDILSAKLAS